MLLLIEQIEGKSQQIKNLLESLDAHFAIWSPHKQPDPPSCDYDHIIISGGGLHVEEIDNPLSFLYREREFLECSTNDCAILGICLGAEILAKIADHQISISHRQQGPQKVTLTRNGKRDLLFANIHDSMFYFNHQRRIIPTSDNLSVLARDESHNLAAFKLKNKKTWGVQFHPENSPQGILLLRNFLAIS